MSKNKAKKLKLGEDPLDVVVFIYIMASLVSLLLGVAGASQSIDACRSRAPFTYVFPTYHIGYWLAMEPENKCLNR